MKTRTEGGVDGTVARLRWINSEEEKKVSDKIILRCYILRTKGIKTL